jgi:hypothetical protein
MTKECTENVIKYHKGNWFGQLHMLNDSSGAGEQSSHKLKVLHLLELLSHIPERLTTGDNYASYDYHS